MDPDDITCRQFIRTLADYLAADLDPADNRLSELHLASCADCTRFLDTYRRTIELSREASGGDGEAGDATPDPLPEDLVNDILAARRRLH